MSLLSLSQVLFTPIAMIMIGVALGTLTAVPSKRNVKAGTLLAAGWAFSSGAALWIVAISQYQQLANFPLFSNFSQIVSNTQYSRFPFGNLEKTTIATLIGLYEVGLFLGFAAFSGQERSPAATEPMGRPVTVPQRVSQPVAPVLAQTVRGARSVMEVGSSRSGEMSQPDTLRRSSFNQPTEHLNDDLLDKNERTIVELFLFGNTTSIMPRVDVSKPEGYYFEGSPSLKLETSKLRQVLDSLVRRNVLVTELVDKMLMCKECGSPNLQLRSMCPECKSMRLSKHNVLEHFACGLIDKQESFRTDSGDLVCPKCNVKLHLVGSDYRNLSIMYICSECNALNKDLLQLMKCGVCGTVSAVGEENEQYIYSYSLSETAAAQLVDQIKPIEACSTHFRSLGYVVAAPAFVMGKSGTQHVFDMLVLDSSHKVSDSEDPTSRQPNDARSMVVEILVSSRPIELAEVTRVYGKVCDIDCDSIIFAVPALTNDARNYAEQFKISVFEGSSIEDALKKSEMISFATERIPPTS